MSAEKTCNCRWDGDTQVQQCTLHQAHVDAIHEWADRARGAEAERDALAAKLAELEGQDPVAWVEVVSTHEGPYNFEVMALLGKGNHLLYARPVPAEMSPEFTDTARSALLWVLWHHQGGSSPVGQPIRQALGMDAHERLSERQVQEAKKWAAISGAKTNDFHRSEPVNARLLEALKGLMALSDHRVDLRDQAKAARSAIAAAEAREMRDEYRSASCDDVARRVDECMTLRAERDALAAKLAELEGQEPTAWMNAKRDMASFIHFHEDDLPLFARPVPVEPVNVDFGMRGENMFFQIGNQSFLLDYKPEEQGEFEFMKAMLLSAFSRITHGNLQEGVAGFGDSPAEAMWDFDKQWFAKLLTIEDVPEKKTDQKGQQ